MARRLGYQTRAIRLKPGPLRVSGKVVVQVTITEEGKVIRACAVKGDPLLWQVSERAAYAAEFAPTKLSGKPVKVTGVITYNFVRR